MLLNGRLIMEDNMDKKIKDDQWHFRCNSEEKRKTKALLKEINKPADFLMTLFLKIYTTNSSRLEMEIENINKERAAIDDKMAELQERMDKLNKRRDEAVEELNSISLYDLNNYRNNDAIIGAVGSIKDYVISRKLSNFNNIPNTLYYEINSSYEVNDIELLKEISANEFDKWQMELNAAEEIPDGVKMNKIADNLKDNFNAQRWTNKWDEFLKTKDEVIIRKANSNGWNPDDFRNFLLKKKYTHEYI